MKKLILIVLIINSYYTHAVDGVIEINQACAVQTGCFSGDTAGFPISINGSIGKNYRLTSDLYLPDNFKTGIEIMTDNVTVDLNRFSIIGPECAENIVDCRPSVGTGYGLHSVKSGHTIKNGSIIGMGASGILSGDYSRIENLSVHWCRIIGIQFKSNSLITNNIISHNGINGLDTIGKGSVINGNTVTDNIGQGLRATSTNNNIINNLVSNNGENGISVGDFSRVQNNHISLNDGVGISARNNCDVSNNSIHDNRSIGLFIADRSKVFQNTLTENTGVGLSISGIYTVYQNNYMHNNQSPVSGGINLGGNFCHDQICP